MKPISIHDVRRITGGRALSTLPASCPDITSVSTDSRIIDKGALFVAIRGENHDAHQFLPQVAQAGAAAALVEVEPPQRPPGLPLIQVASTRLALGRLARHVRLQMSGKVIAVAGSNGKTGTKHLIDSVLFSRLSGSISPKSYNNDIGVPLAIFPADPRQDYLVLELGTNHPGEIRALSEIAMPDIAVITNCSAEHLEGLGDMVGVVREEASIIEGLNVRGLLVVNGDHPDLLEAVRAFPGKRVTFGFKPTNDLFATDVSCTPSGVSFRLNGRRDVFVPLLGRHIASNALAAIAVGRRMGLLEDVIVEALSHAHGPEMRLQLQRVRGITLLNDAYNANPASMRAALQTLCDLPAPTRRIAILADMRELGKWTDSLHCDMGRFVAECGLDLIICIGEKAAIIAESAQAAGVPTSAIRRFPTTQSAVEAVPELLREGDLVLLKGSRYMRLETIAAALGVQTVRRAAS